TCRSEGDEETASRAGADEILLSGEGLVERILRLVPQGVQHIVEVAFAANVAVDADVLAAGGSIATYATTGPTPTNPFWPLLFKNSRIFFLGSDDFPHDEKVAAARAINQALAKGWQGLDIGQGSHWPTLRRPMSSSSIRRRPGV